MTLDFGPRLYMPILEGVCRIHEERIEPRIKSSRLGIRKMEKLHAGLQSAAFIPGSHKGGLLPDQVPSVILRSC